MTAPDHNPFAAPQVQDVSTAVDGQIDFTALRTTGNGLGLIYASLLLLVLLVVGGGAGLVVFARQAGAAGGPSLALQLLIGAFVLTGLLSITGGIMCTTVPAESGAKRLAIASVPMQAVQFFAPFGLMMFGFGVSSFFGFGISGLLNVASMTLFLLFLRRLAQFIRRNDLARRAIRVLVLLWIVVLGGGTLLGTAPVAGGDFGAIFVLVGGIPALMTFVMYANLVSGLGTSIRNPNRPVPTNHLG